jgi:signal transduction histidine kinase
LGEGRVNYLRFDPDGTLWVATGKGLSRLKSGRIATLSSKNGLPCDAIHWLIEDDTHSFWLCTSCGLVRIARPELEAWVAAVERDKDAKPTIQFQIFDSSDGVRSFADPRGYSPLVAKSTDGKLWFLPLDGVSVVDPRRLPFNALPPPVHIEQIVADRKTFDVPFDKTGDVNGHLRLPPLSRDLQIDYTALSLVAPEKILFRYKLEGYDSDWQDVGNRRQAFYTNLPPRSYRFRVMACNNSGVWNEAGTFLDFSIAPAYYQTWWFLASCGAAFLVLLGALYRLRLLQVSRQFTMRMEERVNERTRIARDFHDTLLQSFQGVLLKFHAVTYKLPDRSEAREMLESVIDQAQQAVTEGRDAVQGLRSSTVVTNELAQAISGLGEELVADQTGRHPPDFRVIVEGASRDLVPLVRDEVYRIAGEALRNAFRHAQAGRIEVEIQYAKRQLRLWVRDNGKGIDPKVLAEGGREGHYGLAGMHERAKLVGGKLAVLSKLDSGTEVELTIPASVAYAKSPDARWSLFSRKGT